jgi:flavin-dependent dehydrogenase
MYDVIIVGASFAGLAVAHQLRGQNVLLIDRKPIGSGNTSACGTALPVLEHWGLSEAVLQTHDRFVLNKKNNKFEFLSPFLWCTFDYELLCRKLFEESNAEFIQSSVRGFQDGFVETNRGSLTAQCIVDASGWRSVLASSSPSYGRSEGLNFGIETIRPTSIHTETCGLQFWYDPEILENGVGWIFPKDQEASYGLGSYRGARELHQPLTRFIERFEVEPDGVHGTYFPSGLRSATAGSIFLVGDAAGMCIGLTGEGIRPALFFGEACGNILHRIIENEISLEEGLAEYRAFVEKKRFFFNVFKATQGILTRVPPRWIDGLAYAIRNEHIWTWLHDKYWGLTQEW